MRLHSSGIHCSEGLFLWNVDRALNYFMAQAVINLLTFIQIKKMKKIVYLLAAIIPALAFTACDDHDDIPDVDFNVTISGGKFANNDIYVVQGDTLAIDGVQVVNNEHGKAVTIPYVNYYFNYSFIGQNAIEPYGFDIAIPEELPVGQYALELTAPVFAVDKAPGYAVISYRVNVVSSADDIPDATVQTVQTTAHVTDNASN